MPIKLQRHSRYPRDPLHYLNNPIIKLLKFILVLNLIRNILGPWNESNHYTSFCANSPENTPDLLNNYPLSLLTS